MAVVHGGDPVESSDGWLADDWITDGAVWTTDGAAADVAGDVWWSDGGLGGDAGWDALDVETGGWWDS